MLLAGDIGGTKTELALVSRESGGPRTPLARAEFRSGDYPSLEEIVREFLAGVGEPVEHACFDVAGPVIDGRSKITNLTWVVDAEKIRRELNFKSVHLLNDLEAIAAAIPLLQPDDLRTINHGEPVKGGAIAVIAPGTGLGEGFLTWHDGRYIPHPSEGGHADFAPTDAVQVGILQRLQKRYDHVSMERVCSGIGIPNIYDYLRESGHAGENPEIARKLEEAQDRTRVIVEAAVDPAARSPLCKAALETFVSILAAESSNMALKLMATGGVYLAGGIPPRIAPALEDGRFMEVFRRKGRLSVVLERMPVHIVVCRAALIGAATRGLELAEKEPSSTSDPILNT